MFENLVESGSHKEDLARKSSFILGTVVFYAVLLTGLGILSVYLYDAELENQNLELTALVAPVPIPPQQEQTQEEAKPAERQVEDRTVATRTELVANTDRPDLVPKETSVQASKVPPVPKGVPVTLGSSNTEATRTGPIGPPGQGSGGGGAPAPTNIVKDVEEPPPPTPTPKKITAPISGGVLNGKAISLPKPPYPPVAKAARASGTVTVQVTIDENGNVISARAVSGHPLLQSAAVQAARSAKFSPTKLSGQPVKVTGVITYNFVAQ
ncbi:MAG TPA: TonB family protein [Pyrinomonadaceae bacterium]|jgi:protein TonB